MYKKGCRYLRTNGIINRQLAFPLILEQNGKVKMKKNMRNHTSLHNWLRTFNNYINRYMHSNKSWCEQV